MFEPAQALRFVGQLRNLQCAEGIALPATLDRARLARSGRGRQVMPAVVLDTCFWYKAGKFILVGATGIVVNSLALAILYAGARLPLLLASAGAVEVAIIHNFLLDNRWTFGRKDVSVRRFARFNLVSVVALLVTTPTVWALVHYAGLQYLVANLLGIAAAGIVNFAGALWTWGVGRR